MAKSSFEKKVAAMTNEELFSPKAAREAERDLAKIAGVSIRTYRRRMSRNNLAAGFNIDELNKNRKSIEDYSPVYTLSLYALAVAVRDKATEVRLKQVRKDFRLTYVIKGKEFQMVPPPVQLYGPMVSALKSRAQDYGSKNPGFDFYCEKTKYKIDVIPKTSRSGKEGLVLKIRQE